MVLNVQLEIYNCLDYVLDQIQSIIYSRARSTAAESDGRCASCSKHYVSLLNYKNIIFIIALINQLISDILITVGTCLNYDYLNIIIHITEYFVLEFPTGDDNLVVSPSDWNISI